MGCCNTGIRKESIENYVLDELDRKLFTDTSIRKLSAMLSDYNQKRLSESSMAFELANEELDEINRKIGKILHFITESDLSIDTVKEEMKQLEAKKYYLEGYIHEISLNNNVALMSETMITELIIQSKESIKNRNIQDCRSFLHSYIDKVISYPNRVEVFFKIRIPDDDSTDTLSQLKSERRKRTLHEEYTQAG
jgi:site-specific DNA recombinase